MLDQGRADPVEAGEDLGPLPGEGTCVGTGAAHAATQPHHQRATAQRPGAEQRRRRQQLPGELVGRRRLDRRAAEGLAEPELTQPFEELRGDLPLRDVGAQ